MSDTPNARTGGTSSDPSAPRNLVVCMDGTGNRLKVTGNTNVLHLFSMLENSPRQLTFYTPGVGTRGDPAALTEAARRYTKLRGLISGYGMRRDISEAYSFLVHNHRPGDRIFIFGFSRGAFAALGLAGICRLYGLIRPESDNMIGEVVKRASSPTPTRQAVGTYRFRGAFSRRLRKGRSWHAADVHFLGLWDTVKALKYFRWLTRIKEEALHYDLSASPKKRAGQRFSYHPSWPFTKRPRPSGIGTFRHAVSIDDRRIPYDVLGIRPHSSVDFEEVWFAGVHSDVGGSFQEPTELDPSLGRITLKWMVEAAVACGLRLDPDASKHPYHEYCTIRSGDAKAPIHRNSLIWSPVGIRRRLARRTFRRRFLSQPIWKWFKPLPKETIRVHQSVWDREEIAEGETPGHLPSSKAIEYVAVDKDWQDPRPGGHLGQKQPPPAASEDDFQKEVQGERANLALALLLWIVAAGAIVTALRGFIGPLEATDAAGVVLSHWEVFLAALLSPLVTFGLWSLTFTGPLMVGAVWFAAFVVTLAWVGLVVTGFGSLRGRSR